MMQDPLVLGIDLGTSGVRIAVIDSSCALLQTESASYQIGLINPFDWREQKTELTPSKLEAIVDELELSLQQSNSREITSSEIGELVLGHLKGLSEGFAKQPKRLAPTSL